MLLGWIVALVMAVSGCGAVWDPQRPPSAAAPSAGPPGSDHLAGVQGTLDLLATAVTDGDDAAFRSVVSYADPGFARKAAVLWRNLERLPLSHFELTAQDRRAALSSERRVVLGETAWAQQVRIRWRLTGEQGTAEHQVWVTFFPGSAGPAVAGTDDGPTAEAQARPIWWLEPVTVARSAGSVAVVAEVSASAWAVRAAAAARTLGRHSGSSSGWNGRLVIEVPSSQSAFDGVLGVQAGTYAGIAAVAWPEGPDPQAAALRVVVNLAAVKELSADGIAVLLAHEATHVATRSPASAAPLWLVEGYADHLAYDAYPATRRAASAGPLAEVRRSGAPSVLPGDQAFTPTSPDLDQTYGLSWLACRFAADTYSETRLATFYSRVDAGTAVGTAIPAVFGVTQAQFVDGWRRYLVALSRKR